MEALEIQKTKFINISRIPSILRCFGYKNILPRVSYLVQKKLRILKLRTPRENSKSTEAFIKATYSKPLIREMWHAKQNLFFPKITKTSLKEIVPNRQWNEHVTSVCNSALEGSYLFFSRWKGELGWPPNFNLDPINQTTWSTAIHWTEVKCSTSPKPQTDVKLVWEASRLSLAYFFIREYRFTEDDKWAEHFWELVESWVSQNPVNQTAAWACGQEVSFRFMAILWGLFNTLDSKSATSERLSMVYHLAWQTGRRIAATTNYAISQKNNHSLSEATMLWTIGNLFSEFKESNKWKRNGKKILTKEVNRQIYSDGSYVQHSFNYHRVMLDDLMWAIKIGEFSNERLPESVYKKFSLATHWLAQFVDKETGRAPNYGANDGANILPLSCTDYLDFRPTLRAAEVIAGIKSAKTQSKIVDEKSLWINNCVPAEQSVARTKSWSASDGGYHVIRTPSSRLMLRSTNYSDRPSHADMLHLDLWYRGVNILSDSGSYRYHHEDPKIKSYFASVEAHNTVQVRDFQQMTKGPSFLWLDWPEANFEKKESPASITFESVAKFSNNKVSYQHTRKIENKGELFVITDSVECGSKFIVRWHLTPDLMWKQTSEDSWVGTDSDKSYRIKIAGHLDISFETSLESLYYGEKRERPLLKITSQSQVLTYLSPTD